jgi:hypothetical protein
MPSIRAKRTPTPYRSASGRGSSEADEKPVGPTGSPPEQPERRGNVEPALAARTRLAAAATEDLSDNSNVIISRFLATQTGNNREKAVVER